MGWLQDWMTRRAYVGINTPPPGKPPTQRVRSKSQMMAVYKVASVSSLLDYLRLVLPELAVEVEEYHRRYRLNNLQTGFLSDLASQASRRVQEQQMQKQRTEGQILPRNFS